MKKHTNIFLALLVMLSVTISSCNMTVLAEDIPILYENSWRYSNGVLQKSTENLELYATNTPWSDQGSYFINDIGEEIKGATLKGIDVSKHQGTIDWKKVKETDVDFAIIRCGFGDNYTDYDDIKWEYNANACTELGIPFGVYIYSYAQSIAEAKSEAAHVLRLVQGYNLSFPIYLDLEDEKVGACSNELIGQMAETFCNIVQNAGYKVGIYANKNWWTTRLTDSVFTNPSWYKWVAQYNSVCTYTSDYTMWQATSKGSINGISGNVDINFWFGNPPETDNTDYTYPNTYTNTGNFIDDIVGVAQTQVGYTELSSPNGTPVIDSETPYYTKYGEHYGNSYGHWCAFFVLWCANQADIPTSIICKSASCGNCDYFTKWFKSNNRWKDSDYIPKKGDIIFFDWEGDNRANHVGIVVESGDNFVTTIEGNTGGANGYLVAYRERNESILGYGVPDYNLIQKLNGISLSKQTAYVLPDNTSSTVWETWTDDELQVLCEDGGYYLVLYPYIYTGKFVAAYVPKNTVSLTSSVPDANDFYSINKTGQITKNTSVYHNPSTDDLMNGTTNYKIRASLQNNENVSVLFEDGDFYFIKTDTISGYVLKNDVTLKSDTEESLMGDINGDFKIDSADAGLILRYDVGLITLTPEQMRYADINTDSKIDSADAGLILRFDAGITQ